MRARKAGHCGEQKLKRYPFDGIFGAHLKLPLRFTVALLPVFFVGAAQARDARVQRVTPVNTPTQFFFNAIARNCTGLAAQNIAREVEVLVPEKPSHGEIVKSHGAAPVSSCPGRLGYATVITYVPARNYAGYDHFQLRVLFNLRIRMESRLVDVTIHVGT
jgi:hypothetical protein